MKKIITTVLAVGIAAAMTFAGSGVSSAAQGGISGLGLPSHGWFKVARTELNQRSAHAACTSTGLSTWNCNVLAGAVERERNRNPRANGYWSEFYVTGAVRSGTW